MARRTKQQIAADKAAKHDAEQAAAEEVAAAEANVEEQTDQVEEQPKATNRAKKQIAWEWPYRQEDGSHAVLMSTDDGESFAYVANVPGHGMEFEANLAAALRTDSDGLAEALSGKQILVINGRYANTGTIPVAAQEDAS